MRVCYYEDDAVLELEPLTLMRPVFELLCGQSSLRSKQSRYFQAKETGAWLRPNLAALFQLQHAELAVNDLAWLRAGPLTMINGRWLPPANQVASEDRPHVAMVGGEVAYIRIGAEQAIDCSLYPLQQCIAMWNQLLPHRSAGGRLMGRLWDLVEHNAEQLREDWPQSASWGNAGMPAVVGSVDDIAVHPSAKIDPFVVADTRSGPIVVDREARIDAFTRLEGPCYIGPHTHILGAKIRSGVTIGPHCRIGGEVEASIVHGYTNKYHDGFLGHSYVGEWVNLGAGTSNSDLRNDYGEVKVIVNGQAVDTGLYKVGCFIGDHTKTGLGTLLNTGSSIGAFCSLLSGETMPKHVPSFCTWGVGGMAEQADVGHVLETAAKAMDRRGCALTQTHSAFYRDLCEKTAEDRRLALRRDQLRRLRRSA